MNTIDIARIRSIFQDNIPVKIISEEIFALPQGTSQAEIKEVMDKENFDIIGARNTNGTITGYYHRDDVADKQQLLLPRPFIHDHIISDSASILTAFRLLSKFEYLFLLEENRINRLITRSDLDKIPVRLWLFGIISILELQLKEIIESEYPGEGWKNFITENRVTYAKKLHNEKVKHNEETELIQCLQFCDLKEIIIKSEKLMLVFEKVYTANDLEEILSKIMNLRDYLAHAQKITKNFTTLDLQETSNHIEKLFGCLNI